MTVAGDRSTAQQATSKAIGFNPACILRSSRPKLCHIWAVQPGTPRGAYKKRARNEISRMTLPHAFGVLAPSGRTFSFPGRSSLKAEKPRAKTAATSLQSKPHSEIACKGARAASENGLKIAVVLATRLCATPSSNTQTRKCKGMANKRTRHLHGNT